MGNDKHPASETIALGKYGRSINIHIRLLKHR
jgi:hypothetical protein